MTAAEMDGVWSNLPVPERLSPRQMLEELETVNVLAPLVRCSKLPFRHLVSLYETHITHTPMMLAPEFSRSQIARVADFSTSADERGVFWMEPRASASSSSSPSSSARPACHPSDAPDFPYPSASYHRPRPHSRLPPTPTRPTPSSRLVRGALVAQLASPNAASLADAAELLSPYVDGVDLNCGCPQKWAYAEGIGCALLRRPEQVADMVRAVHDRLGWDWPVSIKIRIDPDLKLTDQLVRTALAAHVSHITIHGRTRHQPSTDPVSVPGIRFAVESVGGCVPCVANGDLWDLADAEKMRDTGVRGVMAARGLLANPALFAGYTLTPQHAVEHFTRLSTSYGLVFNLYHRHVSYMLEARLGRAERIWLNSFSSTPAVVDYLASRGLDVGPGSRVPLYDANRGYNLLATA
ncbi:tRNA dihydrouridine synthase [Cryptotrichosporon argae]